MVLSRLAMSNIRVRKIRAALTIGAIALSVSLVVAVTSGYKSMEAAALKFMARYMGTADALIEPGNWIQGSVPEILVGELRADSAVKLAIARLQSERRLKRAADATRPSEPQDRTAIGGMPTDETNITLMGVRLPEDTTISAMDLTAGKWFDSSSDDVAVLDQVAQQRLGVNIGDEIELPGIQTIKVKVVGLVHKPAFFAERQAGMYLPLQTLQKFTNQQGQLSRILINLKDNADAAAFQQRWDQRLSEVDRNLKLLMRRDSAGETEKNLRTVQVLSYLGGTVSMLTAMFIIFTALTMGVAERQRSLALLRAIGTTRGQVFRLVVIEGILFSIVGIILGTLAGLLWLHLLYWKYPDFFPAGAVVSYGGVLFGGAGSLLTALAASLMPAWSASRMSPLEAMNPLMTPPSHRPPIGWAMLGLVLISIDPLLFYGPLQGVLAAIGVNNPEQAARSVQFGGHFVAGLPGVVIGFFFLAPLLVWIVEYAVTPLISVLFAIPHTLLRQQLSTGLWRAAGTAAALMVGLATLIAMQVQGHTLISGWRLPDKFPDIFIWSPDPISWKDQDQIEQLPGIESGHLMAVAMTTPAGDSKTALALAAAMGGQNTGMMFFGVDPDQAFKMVEMEFRDNGGKPYPHDQQLDVGAQVVVEMKKGRRILITDEFRQVRHLKIGDTIPLQTSVNGVQTYTICGIIWSPGADLIISMYDLGHLLDRQTAGSVFGTLDDAKRDFGVSGARIFAADLQIGLPKEELLKTLQKSLGDRGLVAGDVRQIKDAIERTFYRLLSLLSLIAVAALAVASLGVANTLMASVRSRRWQFGVLRSVGVTRGELLRLILAEAAMLGAVGVVLGFAAGAEIALDAHKLVIVILGYAPDVVFPWNVIAMGCLAVMALAIVASFWPAANLAKTEPLELIQAGRAST